MPQVTMSTKLTGPASTANQPLSKGGCVGLCVFSVVVYVALVHAFLLYKHDGSVPSLLRTKTAGGAGGTFDATKGFGMSQIDQEVNQQCKFYLGESAIPMAGLGLFTAIDIKKGEPSQPMPDICIYTTNMETDHNMFNSHSYSRDVWNGRFEGDRPRAACEGFVTLWNSMPESEKTSKRVPMRHKTNAGLHRATHPGAGAITQYYGATSIAVRDVAAGSEITVDYGDYHYSKKIQYKRTSRTVEWLRKHAWCIDLIDIRQSTDPQMGRGAFAKRRLPRGAIVGPAPLQVFRNRSIFHKDPVESVFVNYCLEIPGTNLLLFPYGPAVNLINHASNRDNSSSTATANVAFRWSQSPASHTSWIDLPLDQFWKMLYPGALVLEVVAMREIEPGEELFLDYGPAWEAAWNKHVASWRPVPNAAKYVYPIDMNTSLPFRTLEEQQENPYPKHICTVCHRFDRDKSHPPGTRLAWKKPPKEWPMHMSYCQILKRYKKEGTSEYFYTAGVGFYEEEYNAITIDTPESDMLVEINIPHHALSFAERPYQSDMSLPNGFRHPLALADELIPKAWLKEQ